MKKEKKDSRRSMSTDTPSVDTSSGKYQQSSAHQSQTRKKDQDYQPEGSRRRGG